MNTITKNELKNKLSNLKACTAVSIETETFPKLLKNNRNTGEPNPYGQISKIGTMNGLIGCSYEIACNNQLGREDKELVFKSQERKWGKMMDNKVLIEHTPKNETNTKYYLQILVKSANKPVYMDGFNIIPSADIEGFLPTKSNPKTQEDINKKIILRDVALENITIIRMLNNEYIVCNDETKMEKIKRNQFINIIENI